MPVNNPFALIAGIQYVDGTAITAGSFTGTVAMSWNGTDVVGLRSDASDNLLVNIAASSGTISVAGTLTHNAAVPAANNVGALVAVASSAAPTYNPGDQVLLSTDLSGNLRVNIGSVVASNNITEWASTLLGAPSNYGTSPGAVTVIGVNAFITNTVAVSQSGTWNVGLNAGSNNIGSVNQGTSPWVVSLTSTTITGTVAVTQSTSPWTVQGDSASGAAKAGNPVQTGAVFNTTQPTVTTGQTVENQATARGAQIVATGVDTFNVTVNAALPAGANVIGAVTQSGGPWTVSGTVAVTQSTSPWVVSLASTTITGTVAVTQSTSPWVVSGGLTHNAAAPAANNVGALVAVASTAAPTYSTGDQVLLSTDLAGNLRVSITGSVVASNNITEWNSVALGSPSAYGTSPGAVNVIGVNAFITNTVTVSGTVTANQGTANATPWNENIAQVGGVTVAATAKGTQGTNAFPVQDLKDAGRTPVVLFMDAIAAITTEALATMSINKGGTVTSATQYTVTAGKTLRIQTISVSIQETNSTVQWTKFRFRSAATVTATSPLFAGTQTGTSGATGSVGQATVPVPDGLEIAAGQQVGVSHIESATNATVTYCIVGYEY